MFDSEKVKAAWEKYVALPGPIPEHIDGVRQEIVDSWRRSKGKVDPFGTDFSYFTAEELKTRLEENALLVQIAYPYLIKFYEYLLGTNHQFMLADKDGCQFELINDGELLNEMTEEKQLLNGRKYSEAETGTNGIGICLALQKPMMVLGYEHFHSIYTNLACYGAPIYDPTTHSVIGCINITGPLEAYQPIIMGMLSAAVSGIEKEFELTKVNNMLNLTSETFASGILLLDKNKKIIHCNKSVLNMLMLKKEEVFDKNLENIIIPESLPQQVASLDSEITNLECTLLNKNGKSLDLCLNVTPQKDNIYGLQATLLRMDSQKTVHRLANQMAGFFATYTFNSIIGTSAAMRNVKELGKVAARLETPVLITGEHGTGKEILAQAIHNESSFKDGPFVTVHCGAVSKTKLDDDLWGYEGNPCILGKEKGKPGKIELANGGTLFLSDIGSMPLETQMRFLSFLKTKQFMRAGGKYPKTSNIRIIGSSKTNLLSLVEKKMFRSDLYYMLSTFNITVPPLRERPEDIMVLSKKYAEQYNTSKQPISFDRESSEALMNYQWQGNMRQLESVIESAVNAARKSVIRLPNLPLDIINDYYSSKQKTVFSEKDAEDNEKFLRSEIKEYNKILYAVKKTGGNVKETAKMLSMPLSTLYRKLTKYEIDVKDYRN